MDGLAEFEVHRLEGAAVLTVAGEFDLAVADDFSAAQSSAIGLDLPLVVDLTACEFIDSTGIACIVWAYRAAREAGHRFALAGSGLQVRRVLRLVGMRTAVPYFSRREDAIAHAAGLHP